MAPPGSAGDNECGQGNAQQTNTAPEGFPTQRRGGARVTDRAAHGTPAETSAGRHGKADQPHQRIDAIAIVTLSTAFNAAMAWVLRRPGRCRDVVELRRHSRPRRSVRP